MFRLMATIKEILQKEFNKSKPDLLIYTPNKKGSEAVEKQAVINCIVRLLIKRSQALAYLLTTVVKKLHIN